VHPAGITNERGRFSNAGMLGGNASGSAAEVISYVLINSAASNPGGIKKEIASTTVVLQRCDGIEKEKTFI
jgi:hypothetical protein